MSDSSCIGIQADVDIITARQRGRDLGVEVGFPKTDLALIATAISELARNILTYAGEGETEISVEEAGGRRGLAIVARDQGPGISDIALASRTATRPEGARDRRDAARRHPGARAGARQARARLHRQP